MASRDRPGSVFPVTHAEIAIRRALTTPMGRVSVQLVAGAAPAAPVKKLPVKEGRIRPHRR